VSASEELYLVWSLEHGAWWAGPTTPDVPRGSWWNDRGTLRIGYWDLLDEVTRLRATLDEYDDTP
jgi:hypothetical protein